MRRFDHGTIAADIGHRAQRVELLRARHARHAIHGQHGGFLGRQLLQQFRILRRPDERHQRAAFAQQTNLVRVRAAHLEHDVGRGPQSRRALDDVGAGGAIGVVAEIGCLACARLHGHGKAELDQFFHHFRHGCNALLAGKDFPRHSYLQRHDVSLVLLSVRYCCCMG
jgi:hypothetical protein